MTDAPLLLAKVQMPEKGVFAVRCPQAGLTKGQEVVVNLGYGIDLGTLLGIEAYDPAVHGPSVPGYLLVRAKTEEDARMAEANATAARAFRKAFLEMAQEAGRTLLRTQYTSVEFTSMTIDYLNQELAPMITRHGVLLDVYGEGVLIMGDSGIGKSETAIELIKRGHRLVADDAVEIRRIGSSLIGTAPELIRNYLELRGIGVIDIKKLFGMSGVQSRTQIDLVMKFEEWKPGFFYDRLGLEQDYTQIMGVTVPCVTVPVSAGRNLAGLVEIAVMNNRNKKYGYNSAQEFVNQVDSHIDTVTKQNKTKNLD